MQIEAELILQLHVRCEKDRKVKNEGGGYLRVIPITGGTFEGKIKGEIVAFI